MTPELQRGAQGSAVSTLQLLLTIGGWSPGPIDGAFGPRTESALLGAQRALGLTRTGASDEPTLKALRALHRPFVEVPRARTPLTRAELVEALRRGHVLALGEDAGDKRIQVAKAQLMLEHGANLRAIWTFNLGNLMTGAHWQGPWFRMRAPEKIGGRWVDTDSEWRASVDAAGGAAGYWSRLQERYGGALPFFDVGDPDGAARALKRAGYYTADEAAYARAMVRLYVPPLPPL